MKKSDTIKKANFSRYLSQNREDRAFHEKFVSGSVVEVRAG